MTASPVAASVASGAAGQGNAAHPFKAELDLAELDDRRRAGFTWPARGVELSRSRLVFRSRRMCYAGRSLCIAVHLVDDRPVPLFGDVVTSEYDGDGLYKTEVALQPLPTDEPIRLWFAAFHAHPARG